MRREIIADVRVTVGNTRRDDPESLVRRSLVPLTGAAGAEVGVTEVHDRFDECEFRCPNSLLLR